MKFATSWLLASLVVGGVAQAGGVVDNEVTVFSEAADFSFQALLEKKEKMRRDPASFMPAARVISVKRELALTEADENKMPQDLVLNSGTEKGLVEGMVLKVRRKVPLLDPYRENQQKELEVEYGSVEIIHSQRDLAVARLIEIKKVGQSPVLNVRQVLIGDYVGQ